MVHILDEDAFERIVLVEGEYYRKPAYRHEPEGEPTDNSFQGVKGAWERGERGLTGRGKSIYGIGGWNRYFVRDDGEIVFSYWHALSEGRKKARGAGFRLSTEVMDG